MEEGGRKTTGNWDGRREKAGKQGIGGGEGQGRKKRGGRVLGKGKTKEGSRVSGLEEEDNGQQRIENRVGRGRGSGG